jgi:hypothetical protein
MITLMVSVDYSRGPVAADLRVRRQSLVTGPRSLGASGQALLSIAKDLPATRDVNHGSDK